uniref:Uncharacterized protein n=1 Tax=Vespula pensylvanica TaxID=30213 RepID=A0A834U7T1_VESPE|nr:hypothetical protein H0235_010590 [Vespula pensylvanica]
MIPDGRCYHDAWTYLSICVEPGSTLRYPAETPCIYTQSDERNIRIRLLLNHIVEENIVAAWRISQLKSLLLTRENTINDSRPFSVTIRSVIRKPSGVEGRYHVVKDLSKSNTSRERLTLNGYKSDVSNEVEMTTTNIFSRYKR